MLLVGPLVFLVENDQPDVWHWCEYGTSRADHDIEFALSHTNPLILSLAWTDSAMQHGYTALKS